jgi:hypothetical protein
MLEHPMVIARFIREASAAGHIGNQIGRRFRYDGNEPIRRDL